MSNFLKASRESSRDLMLDAKLNQIASASVPKRAKSPKPIKNKRRYDTPIVQSSDYVANKDIRDIIFDRQLNTIADNAIPGTDQQPTKIVSPVTQEMIEEYKAQQLQPIEVGGKQFKYHPSSLAIDLEPYPAMPNVVFSDDELARKKDEVSHYAKQYSLRQKSLVELDNEEEALRKVYDEVKPQYDRREEELNTLTMPELKARFSYLSPKLRNKKIAIDGILKREFDGIMGIKFPEEMKKIAQTRARLMADLADLDARIQALNTEIIENDARKAENDAVVYATDRVNKERLEAYRQDLEGLNAGQLKIEQQVGESFEDYKNRLINTGSTELSDADIEASANLQSIVKLKNNLKEVSNELSKIENVVKTLEQDERIEINKIFPRFKKQFLETYGANNKDVSEEDIVDFIRGILNQPAVPTSSSAPSAVAVTAVPAKEGKARDKIKLFAKDKGVKLKSDDKLIEIIGKIEAAKHQVPDELINELKPSDLRKCTDAGLLAYFMPMATASFGSPPPKPPPNKAGAGGAEEVKLEGVGIPNYPKLTPFGKVMISPDKLYFKNVLVIRNSHGKPLTGITNAKVSDVMVSILMKCLHGERISKSEINLLSQAERHMYDNLMWMSGAHKVHDHSIDKTAEEMKYKLALIEGELEAGNNSELLKKELHGLLHRMARHGLISVAHAAAYYKETKECYFSKHGK